MNRRNIFRTLFGAIAALFAPKTKALKPDALFPPEEIVKIYDLPPDAALADWGEVCKDMAAHGNVIVAKQPGGIWAKVYPGKGSYPMLVRPNYFGEGLRMLGEIKK